MFSVRCIWSYLCRSTNKLLVCAAKAAGEDRNQTMLGNLDGERRLEMVLPVTEIL